MRTSIRDLEPGSYFINPDTLEQIKKAAEKEPIGAYFALNKFKFIPHELMKRGQIVKID